MVLTIPMNEEAEQVDPMVDVLDDAAWLDAAGIAAARFAPDPSETEAFDTGVSDTERDTRAASAEGRIDATMLRVEEFACRTARDMAEQLAAIDDLLLAAAAHPEVFAGPLCKPGAETKEFARRSAICEIAVNLGVSENAVHNYAFTARMLRQSLPAVWLAIRDGLISYQKVRVIVDAAGNLPDDPAVLDAFDRVVAAAALKLTPAKLRQKARATVEKLHPVTATERHDAAMTERRFWVDADKDSMAWLGGYVPADVAMRAEARVDANARRLAGAPGETRTLAQLRADAFADIVTGDGTANEVRTSVNVTVPVLTLLKEDSPEGYRANPAVLNGYGPIDADMARRLCRNAPSLFRLLTDPIDGAILTLDRKSYRPHADLKRLILALRRTCSFPGCNRLACQSDLDHSLDWLLGGVTSLRNMAPLCRAHHRVKHMTRWKMNRDAETGDISWTSPTGITHDTDPPPF